MTKAFHEQSLLRLLLVKLGGEGQANQDENEQRTYTIPQTKRESTIGGAGVCFTTNQHPHMDLYHLFRPIRQHHPDVIPMGRLDDLELRPIP